jgi:hypothetical protein
VLCCIVLSFTVLYRFGLYYTVLYCRVMHCDALCCFVQHYHVPVLCLCTLQFETYTETTKCMPPFTLHPTDLSWSLKISDLITDLSTDGSSHTLRRTTTRWPSKKTLDFNSRINSTLFVYPVHLILQIYRLNCRYGTRK